MNHPVDADRPGRHLDTLRELADLGMGFARALHMAAGLDRPGTPAAPETVAPLAVAFAHVSRGIRHAVALEARLAQAAEAARADVRRAAHVQAVRRIRHRLNAVIAADPQARTRRSVYDRLDERLTDCDIDDDLASDRPPADIVARICRALHVAPPAADVAPLFDDTSRSMHTASPTADPPFPTAAAVARHDHRQPDAASTVCMDRTERRPGLP